MAASDHTELSGLSRYDLVLAIIPSAFVLAWVLAAVAGLPLRSGLLAASVVGVLAVADALFLNPPRGREPGSRRSGGVTT